MNSLFTMSNLFIIEGMSFISLTVALLLGLARPLCHFDDLETKQGTGNVFLSLLAASAKLQLLPTATLLLHPIWTH